MFISTKNRIGRAAGAALLIALSLSDVALAQTSLTDDERAAQHAIVDNRNSMDRAPASNTVAATLAYNERAAQSAIANSPLHTSAKANAFGDATLLHNERAAQRTIADAPTAKSPRLTSVVAKTTAQP